MGEQKNLQNSAPLNINTIHNLFVKRLVSDENKFDFISQLQSAQSNSSRIKLCYEYMHNRGLLPHQPPVSKHDQTSIDFRLKGNQNFVKKKNKMTLYNYNYALKYASDPKLKSLIYGNRSAVMLSMKKYKECLLDIERAFNAGYEEKLKPKLLNRKALAEKALCELDGPAEGQLDLEEARKLLFDLTDKNIDGLPCANASIKIHNFPSMGRGLIATEDIVPGQVLIREPAYATAIKNEFLMLKCYFCCIANVSMIPCENCTVAMFCDDNCRSKAWDQGHKYECPLMSHLSNMLFCSEDLLRFQILLKARSQFSSLSDMFTCIETVEKETVPELKGFTQNTDNTLIYDSNSYAPIHMLNIHVDGWKPHDMYCIYVLVVTFLHMLVKYTTFFDGHPSISEDILTLDDNDYVWQIGGLLLHISMLTEFHDNTIFTADLQLNPELIPFASGLYPLYSLFNHSCTPNMERVFLGSTLIGKALRPIKKGEQICISYGPHYTIMERSERQELLEDKHIFSCECKPCTEDWPLMELLNLANPNVEGIKEVLDRMILQKMMIFYWKNNKKAVYDAIQDMHKYIVHLVEFMPCRELADLEALTKMNWAFFANNDYLH